MQFTNDSLLLQDFSNSIKNIPKLKLDYKNIVFLTQIIKVIQKSYYESKMFNNIDFQYKNVDTISNLIQYPTPIADSIRSFQHHYHYSFKLNTIQVNFNLFVDNKKSQKELISIIKRVFMVLYFAHFYSQNDHPKEIDIFFYFTDHKKLLNQDKILSTIHVNSAFTNPCNNNVEVHIYRFEEWFKVFLHETMHFMRLDFSCSHTDQVDELISSFIPLKKNDIRIYEAYSEFWALIINSLFTSFFHTKIKNDFTKIFNKFMIYLQNEMVFSVFQMNKILNHCNLEYTDLFDKNFNSKTKCKNYKEDSYVISYYIIKAILLFNINDFLKWVLLFNKSIKFNKSSKNIMNFGYFIENHFKDTDFIDIIQKIKEIKTKNSFIQSTLRMSIIEEN